MTKNKKNVITITYSIIVVIFLGLLIFRQYPCIAYYNDEMTMKSIASGLFTGKPDGHLVYMLYPLGLILKGLYTINAKIPWFDGMLLVLQFFCWGVLIERIGKLFEKLPAALIAQSITSVIVVIIDVTHIIHPEYTILSAWLVAVGIFCFVSDGNYILSAILILLSLWMRKQVFFMALPILALAVLLRLITKKKKEEDGSKKKRYKLSKIGVFLIALSVTSIVSLVIDSIGYGSKEWRDFRDYNEARTEVYDYYGYPSYEQAKEVYDDMGITPAILETLNAYNLALVEDIDAIKLSTLSDISKNIAASWHNREYWLAMTQIILSNVVSQNSKPVGILTYVLVLSGIFLMIFEKQDKKALILLASVFYQTVFITYFTYRGRIPERVLFSIFLMELCFAGGIIFSDKISVKINRWVKYALIVFTLMIGGMLLCERLYQGIQIRKSNEINSMEWESLAAYCNSRPNSLYFVDTASYDAACIRLFEEASKEPNNMVRLGVWTLQSPLYDEYKSRLGLENLNKDLVDNPECYFIQSEDKSLEWLEQFLEDSGYAANVEIFDKIVLPTGRELQVLEIKAKNQCVIQ